jgi:hypothetical protein
MMRARRAAGVVAILLLLGVRVTAQQPPAQQPPASQTQPQTQSKPPSAESMGVSLKNIRKQVSETSPSQASNGSGLRYDFFVDVFGKRPAIDFFKDFDLSKGGAVKWGGVTHQEILNAVTPYPFRLYTGGIELLGGKKK